VSRRDFEVLPSPPKIEVAKLGILGASAGVALIGLATLAARG
jgi:hypothetical protein